MKDMDLEMQRWIALHEKEDTARLLLRHHGEPGVTQAVTQIECRKKAASKLPRLLENPAFMFPHTLSAEQCTSEALAEFHASLAGEGKEILDMTAGLGVDAMTMARNNRITAIDITAEAAAALRHNAEILGLDKLTAICADSVTWLKENDKRFDVIFIDPARRSSSGGRVKALADCEPDVTRHLQNMLAKAPMIIIKASPMLDISGTIEELNRSAASEGHVSALYAVGTPRECKEIVGIIRRGAPAGKGCIAAITILKDGTIVETKATDRYTRPVGGAPEPGMWLYEPYPSVMKLGNRIPIDNVQKLDPNTNLYISETLQNDFPGLAMKIERVEKFNDKNIREIGKTITEANIATRNFIISAPELAKRLKIKEGGEKKIYGARAAGKLVMIVAS